MSWTPRHSWYRNKLSYEFMFRRFAGSSVSMALAAVLKADFHDFIIFFVLSERTIVLLPLEIDRVITAVHLDHHQLRLHIGFGLLSNLFVLLRESLTCVTFTGVSLWSLSLMFYLLPMLLFQKRDKKPAISTKSKQALQAASSQDNEFRHIMSWTQVYVTGLPRSLHPSDDDIEASLERRYDLIDETGWAGRGTTIIKRDDDGRCRGFAFLSFHSREAACVAIERICSDSNGVGGVDDGTWGPKLRAEMSGAAPSKEKKNKKDDDDALPDLRIRRQRKKPARKHPVVVSSNGRRTNLGNKTK
jgi:hypothetical protein